VIELLLIDFKTAPIDEDTKHILEFAVQITKEPLSLSDESFSKIQALGFNDAQIVEMISVVDLFNSFNIFLDALSIDLDF
jgi:alkylhydroperoxidase family enzyme